MAKVIEVEKSTDEKVRKRIKDALEKLNKNFGEGCVMTFKKEGIKSVERFSSGSLGLDIALGGGWPRGRIIEMYGPESSGKSTLALHAIAEIHKNGGIAAYIDAEHAFDPKYAKNLGVEVDNTDKFFFSQPDNGDEAIEVVRELTETGCFDLIIVDSVAALVPKAELQGDVGDSKMGLHARLMSQAMRMLTGSISKTNTSVIFINQLRDKIGIIFGSPEVTTGGNALKFYASIRCDIRRTGQNKDGGEIISSKTKVKVIKNKTFPPFRWCEFDIVFNKGISLSGEIVDAAEEFNIIKKAGSWYSYGETRLGQGRDSVVDILNDNPELVAELRAKILKAI